MTGPIGSSSSNKGLESGWALGPDQEQFQERLSRNIRQLDGVVHHQFGHDSRSSFELNYAYFGGVIDTGAAWAEVDDGSVLLPDSAVSYVERDPNTGVVSSNLSGWTYELVPMAIVTTAFGRISDIVDSRPHEGGGGSGGGSGGGCSTFPCLSGVIMDSQVPLTAVKQYQAFLSIAFTQLTGQIADSQVPESAVTQHLDDFEALMRFHSE